MDLQYLYLRRLPDIRGIYWQSFHLEMSLFQNILDK